MSTVKGVKGVGVGVSGVGILDLTGLDVELYPLGISQRDIRAQRTLFTHTTAGSARDPSMQRESPTSRGAENKIRAHGNMNSGVRRQSA